MQAVFVTTELTPFKDRLPETTNRKDRVAQSLNFLMAQKLSDCVYLLPLFLEQLAQQYPEDDARRDELQQLANQTNKAVPRK